MAIYKTIPSMVRESLIENLLVAQYCVNYRKEYKKWGSNGCYGFPGSILLFSITDCIGSYIIGGDTRKHFDILNDKNYYNLNLSEEDLEFIYKKYRCLLTHNSAMPVDTFLDIGNVKDEVFSKIDGKPILNLVPFLEITRSSLEKFLKDVDRNINNSKQLVKILN